MYFVSLLLLLPDLLHVSGVGPSSFGMGFQQTTPQDPEPKKTQPGGINSGSDILDSNSHDLRLEKSNILLLGPTGSGTYLYKKYELFSLCYKKDCPTINTYLSQEKPFWRKQLLSV